MSDISARFKLYVKPPSRKYRVSHLLRCLVKGNRGVDQLEPILHFQHELLPVGGHALCAVSDQVHVVVVGLEQSLGLLLNLQRTLVGFLPKERRGEERWRGGEEIGRAK